MGRRPRARRPLLVLRQAEERAAPGDVRAALRRQRGAHAAARARLREAPRPRARAAEAHSGGARVEPGLVLLSVCRMSRCMCWFWAVRPDKINQREKAHVA